MGTLISAMGKKINSATRCNDVDDVLTLRRMVELGLEVLEKIKKLEATESFPVGTSLAPPTYDINEHSLHKLYYSL